MYVNSRPYVEDVDVLIDETYHFAVKDADKAAVLTELGITNENTLKPGGKER